MDLNHKKNINIEFHADDYGLFPTQSHRILDCHRNGNLNGISVFPNSSHLSECMSDMYQFSDEVAVTVHLNLIEGKSLCDVPLLTDGEGRLNCSFVMLLLRSVLPGRDRYRQQLKEELYLIYKGYARHCGFRIATQHHVIRKVYGKYDNVAQCNGKRKGKKQLVKAAVFHELHARR